MKKRLIGLLAVSLLAATSLAACNKDAKAGGNSNAAESVFANIASSTLAVRGDRKYFSQYGDQDPWENTNDTITAVLSNDYYYFGRSWPGLEEMSGTRYDRGPNNEILIFFLDPLTNEVMANVVLDAASRQPIAFDDAFGNPFRQSLANNFRVKKGEKNKLEIIDPSTLNYNYLFNTVYGGQANNNPLLAFEIGFDKNYNPTSLYIEFGRIQDFDGTMYISKDIYDGEFIDASTVTIPDVPAPRSHQSGQEKLQRMFDYLKNMNYTVEESVVIDYSPYGEDYRQEYTIKTYLNPDAYYYEFTGDWYEIESKGILGRGEIETDRGLVSYQKTADGFEITNLPKPMRTVKKIFGDFWTYSARSFDVQEDGTFTLAKVDGFETLLWSNLITDGTISGPASPTNIRFTVDEVNRTLAYTYSDEEGIASVSGLVKAVGTTTLPIDLSAAKPFTYADSWEAWYHEDENWNRNMWENLNMLTNNNPDMIPYIYSPYNYERSINTEGDVEIIDEPPFIIETVTAVTYYKSVYQFDTCDEVVAAYSDAVTQARASVFTFDPVKGIYEYADDDINLSMEIYIVKDYVGAISDEIFNYGLVVHVKNLNCVPDDPFIII